MSIEKFVITHEKNNYTILSNHVLQNFTNATALGVWCYLSSLPPNFEVYKHRIGKQFGFGRDKIDKILNILRSHNLIKVIKRRTADGKFTNPELMVLCGKDFIPDSVDKSKKSLKNQYESPHTENPLPAEKPPSTAYVYSVTGKPTPINTIVKNTILPINKKAASQKSKAPSKSKSQIKSGFAGNDEHRALAAALEVDMELEAKRFIDHYRANGRRMLDWDAAFSGWLRKASDFKPRVRSKNVTRQNYSSTLTTSTVPLYTPTATNFKRSAGMPRALKDIVQSLKQSCGI